MIPMMAQALRSTAVKTALSSLGWTQRNLADAIGVSAQTVTNWVKGSDFPRPAALLKLATTLGLKFEDLVVSGQDEPVIAFRRKAAAKTTEAHIEKARHIGRMLRPLVPKLAQLRALRTQISQPQTSYAALQSSVFETRQELELSGDEVLGYEGLIGQFRKNGAVLVPVLWGEKQRHENALHIRLPSEEVTFVFLNLDTRIEDFKFWMAHELAHVYTPDLAGTDEGEDFADAFAGALLFPEQFACDTYRSAEGQSQPKALGILSKVAEEHQVSLYTVFCEVRRYWQFRSLPPLAIDETSIHKVRNSAPAKTVAAILWGASPPSADAYVSTTSAVFKTEFFSALSALVRESGIKAGYVQQVLDCPFADAAAIHQALTS